MARASLIVFCGSNHAKICSFDVETGHAELRTTVAQCQSVADVFNQIVTFGIEVGDEVTITVTVDEFFEMWQADLDGCEVEGG